MKGLYLFSNYDYSEDNKGVGIYKKIHSQVKVLSETICDFDLVCFIPKFKTLKFRRLKYLISYFFCLGYDFKQFNSKNYNYVYIRKVTPTNAAILRLLRLLKQQNHTIKIIYGIPTYPYDKEHKGFFMKCSLIIDKMFRTKLKKYVDRIATLTEDKEIFGIPTVKFTNGVDVSSIPVVEAKEVDKTHIHVIAVAQFSYWHGYERFIEGMGQYYKTYGSKIGTSEYPNITLHLVGDGVEISKYKNLVDKFCLETNGIFHGRLAGDELTKVFNKSSLALCSLGSHRIGLYGKSSMLKSREYLSRGLPLVSSTKIDVIPDDFPYAYYVSEDEKPVDVHAVAKWWNNIYRKKREIIIDDIRGFSEDNCTMKKSMEGVTDYIGNKEGNNNIYSDECVDMSDGGGGGNFLRNPKWC